MGFITVFRYKKRHGFEAAEVDAGKERRRPSSAADASLGTGGRTMTPDHLRAMFGDRYLKRRTVIIFRRNNEMLNLKNRKSQT
jgi:hypothetical protein